MKKGFLILLFYPVIFFGQDNSYELGLLFGGSFNSFYGDTEFTKNTLQPAGGFLMQYNFNNRFSVKSKLLYHIKGGSKVTIPRVLQAAGSIPGWEHRLDLHYVKMPFLAQWNFGKNKWSFFCNIGSYIDYLTRVENIFEGEIKKNYSGNMGIFEKPLEDFSKLDVGLLFGSGLSLQMSERIKIFLELSFEHGLTNTSALESNDVVLTQAMVAAVGVKYNFPINNKTFNGTSTLKCADYNDNESIKVDDKKRSKWRLVLYRDGKKVGKKSKRGKSRLFKKKD